MATISVDHVGWWIVISFFVAIVGSINLFWGSHGNLAKPETLLVVFMAYNILFVTIIGNLMDIGENNRFRFTVDPFVLVLFIFFVRNAIASISSRISGAGPRMQGRNPI